jgi:hypothetical protein
MQIVSFFLKCGKVASPILHGARNDTSLASDWFIAEVVNLVFSTIDMSSAFLDGSLQMIEKLKIPKSENVVVFRVSDTWSQPDSVDPEESAKLVNDVTLFSVGSRIWSNPKFLGIISDLGVCKAHAAEYEHHEACKHGSNRIASNAESELK